MKTIPKKCHHCHKTFDARIYDVKKGHGRFCSHACNTAFRKIPAHKRVWDKIDIKGEDDCWPYKACLNVHGYGVISEGNTKILAHRAAFISKNGDILNDLKVLHSCDNPKCCNPKHLFLGTQADNVKDMHNKGRAVSVSGDKNHMSKLSNSDVITIRHMYHNLGKKCSEIAKEYHVNRNNISFIVSNKTWKHLL
jgi:hypothetical protein